MTIPWGKTFTEAAWVMLLALILSGAGLIFRPDLRPMLGDGKSTAEQPSPGENAVVALSLDEARARFEAGTALFADARPWKAYQEGHIRGAMSLDPAEFDSWAGNFFSQFPADLPIVTYCDGDRCPLSTELAEKLRDLGYEKVFVLKNGWSLWNAAGLPTEQVAQ